jgi:virulence factor
LTPSNPEKSVSRLPIAIFGAGGIAQKAYLPLLATWPDAHILGIYSRTRERLDQTLAAWPIEYGTTDLDALLDLLPTAAFVLTATPSHFELTKKLLEAGVDVYLEKPATTRADLTRRLANLAKEKGRILMVGFNRRYALLYKQAKAIFGLRHIQTCLIEKHRPETPHPTLAAQYLDDIIHQIDLMRFFCGDVTAVHTSYELKNDRLAGAVSIVALPGGGLGTILTSQQAGGWQEKVTLHGDGLTIEVSAFRELRVRYQDHEEIYGMDRPGRWVPELTERGFHDEIQHFFDCVRTREQPMTDGYEAARTQELEEALAACAENLG